MAKEQDVVKLPFRITEFNEDMLIALDRNFKEIEDQLSALQLLIKHITGGGVKDLPNAAEIWKRAENINEDGTISATSLIGQLVEEQISDAAISASKINAGFLIVSDDLWTDNSPINGEIAWNEHDLFWNGRRYTIAAGHTANKYIYWDSMATIYGSSNTMPDLSDTGFLIAINNDGEHQIVWKQAIAKKLIGEEMLAEGAVTATKIANAAIGSAAIAEAAILAVHIHEAAIQTAHIKDAAITSAKIKDIAADKITIGSATTFEPGYDPVDNHVYFQYSVNGTTGWHDTFNSTLDKYMRQKVGDNGTWSAAARIVGQDGQDGLDGTNSYLWVRYSQNANGNPMTTDPTGAKYIGVATTTTASAPSSYASYSWSLIKGTDGIKGEKGDDGQTSYLHIKYSDDGTTFTGNGGEDVGAYIGTYIDFNQADSTNFGDYTWNKVKGEDGQDVRKFTSQPMPPYDVGDLWIGGSDGKNTLICINARATGSFVASDWGQITETVPAVGMGADENCTGLWHFDGSLNSHKGLPAVFDGAFTNSKWGQGVKVDAGETLKIPTADILHPEESSVNMLAYNLASSPNGSVIFDLGDSDGNQAIKAGISAVAGHEGELFIEDEAVQYAVAETSEADFNTGTLTNVVSNPTGDLTLAAEGTNFAVTEDTQAEFEAGTLVNTEYDSGLKLKYTPGPLEYGSDLTTGKTATAIGSTGTNTPEKAINNNTGDAWAYTGSDIWWKVDLGTAIAVSKLRIYGDMAYNANADFALRGSNNDSAWSNVFSGTHLKGAQWREYLFTNAIAYRYYQMFFAGSVARSLYELELMEATETPGTYALSGTWEKEYNLAAVGVARSSTINWNATKPADTSIQVQAAIALDGVNYGSYANCTSGYVIPGITAGMDLSSAKVKIKVTLATTNNTVTPSLNSLTLWVTSAYKTSGNRYRIYDISGVGIAGSSQITWDATLPTGTSVAVKAAISTDGGSSYGAFQTCTSGQAIPVLTNNMDVSNARLKIQEDLATSDYSATPKLNSLDFSVSKAANVAYGINKSELTGWDNIAIQWKTERLSLIINGAESAYIENPGQITTLDTYAFIGSDKAGVNQIETIVDELRIDKVYQEIAKVNAWHVVDAPFYTSEEFKQFPGYVKVETDGLKVYDSLSSLRLLVGSWLKGLIRKYGIKVIDGEIYSSIIRSGAEDATAYIQFSPPNRVEVFGNSSAGTNLKMLEIGAPDDVTEGKGGQIDFYLDGNFMGVVAQQADAFWILNAADIKMSSLNVVGSKNCIEFTENYGVVTLSARESPEARYVDEGIGILTNGECRVDIGPIFRECIEPNEEGSEWYVDLTPYGKAHIYLDEISDNHFIVKDWDGTANIRFKWTLSAVRKNYGHIKFKEVL